MNPRNIWDLATIAQDVDPNAWLTEPTERDCECDNPMVRWERFNGSCRACSARAGHREQPRCHECRIHHPHCAYSEDEDTGTRYWCSSGWHMRQSPGAQPEAYERCRDYWEGKDSTQERHRRRYGKTIAKGVTRPYVCFYEIHKEDKMRLKASPYPVTET